MEDLTGSGKELLIKQDVAEGNHDLKNESLDENNQKVLLKTVSETGSSNMTEGGVDDDSSTFLHFKESNDSGVRSPGLHSALLSQTSISTTDSVVDTCHQQEANSSSLQEDASGDHSNNADEAEEELFVPQSDISNADSRVSQEKTQETDVHSIEERSKQERENIIEKTSFHPGSEYEKNCHASVVNCIDDSDVHSLKKREDESEDVIKTSIPGHLLFENDGNPNDVAVKTIGEIKILTQNKKGVDECKLDELKIDEVPRKASSKVDPLDTGVDTGRFQLLDWFPRQPNKDENKDLAFELCKAHGRPQSLFCIACEISLCDSITCRSSHFGHAVEEKDDISNSVMEKLKIMLDSIESGENIVKFIERTKIKQQFSSIKQNTDYCLEKFRKFKDAQIVQLNREESRLEEEIAEIHQSKLQIWKQKTQSLKSVRNDLEFMVTKAKLHRNPRNPENFQRLLHDLNRGQRIVDELPSLYCQLLSHNVDYVPLDIKVDPISNKWKFVKRNCLDDSLTECATVSKEVTFRATPCIEEFMRVGTIQSVSAMMELKDWSAEEIRWSHYSDQAEFPSTTTVSGTPLSKLETFKPSSWFRQEGTAFTSSLWGIDINQGKTDDILSAFENLPNKQETSVRVEPLFDSKQLNNATTSESKLTQSNDPLGSQSTQPQTNACAFQSAQSTSVFGSQLAQSTSPFVSELATIAPALGSQSTQGTFLLGNQPTQSTFSFERKSSVRLSGCKTSKFGEGFSQRKMSKSKATSLAKSTFLFPPLFGREPVSFAFGSESARSTSFFGSKPATSIPAFGRQSPQSTSLSQPAQPLFESKLPVSLAFGGESARSTSLFGSKPATSIPAFGRQSPQSTSLGQPAQPLLESKLPVSLAFGSESARSTSFFGSKSATSIPAFGRQSPQSTSLSQPAQPLLESKLPVSRAFGGESAQSTSFFGSKSATSIPAFGRQSPQSTSLSQPAQPLFESKPPVSLFTFGSESARSTSLLGSQTAKSTFLPGNPQSNCSVGNEPLTNAPKLGSQPAQKNEDEDEESTSLFGSKSATSIPAFGRQSPQSTSLSQSAQPLFESKLPVSRFTFGSESARSTSLLGSQTAKSTFLPGNPQSNCSVGSEPLTNAPKLGSQPAQKNEDEDKESEDEDKDEESETVC